MRPEYAKELEAMRLRMEKAEAFSRAIPQLCKPILDMKITGDERHQKFGERYKSIPLSWGIGP